MQYSHKKMSGFAIGAALLAAMPAHAATTVLDFTTGNVCGSGGVYTGGPASRSCQFNGDFIGTDYGSSDQVQVRYDVPSNGFGRLPYLSFNAVPTGVAYANAFYRVMSLENTGYITFTPTAGQEVSFTSFDFATLSTVINGRFTLTSGGTTIFDVTTALASTLGNYTANTSYFSTPLIFSFVGDNDEVRLDNITFDVRTIDAPPSGAVPEPASWAMMIMGFGAIGGALRRRGLTRSEPALA